MFLAKILTAVVEFLSLILSQIDLIWTYGLMSFSGMTVIYIVLGAWFGSAFFAATVAELFRQPMGRHFLTGLLIPYVYPIMLARTIHLGEERAAAEEQAEKVEKEEQRAADLTNRFEAMRAERAAKRREKIAEKAGISVEQVIAEEEAAAAAAPPAVEETIAASPVAAGLPPESEAVRAALYDLDVDNDGNRQGPFELQLRDGSAVIVSSVRSMQADFMMCVVSATGKTVRVKYQNVIGASRVEAQ